MSPSTVDVHSTFVPTRGAGGQLLPNKDIYDPAESNFGRDPDDALHEPDPPGYKERSAINARGCGNVLTMVIVLCLIVGLFMVYPVTDWIIGKCLSSSNSMMVLTLV